jgi:hypothetical protein
MVETWDVNLCLACKGGSEKCDSLCLLNKGISSFFGGQSQMFGTPNQSGKGMAMPFQGRVTTMMPLSALHYNFMLFKGRVKNVTPLTTWQGDAMLFDPYGTKANIYQVVYGLSDWRECASYCE